MNTSRSTLPSSDVPGYAHMPFRRKTSSLTDVRACAPSRAPAPIADWWARHDNDGDGASTDALTTCPDESVVEDTVSAFRTALQRADGISSPADLQGSRGDTPGQADDATSPASLDYFAPAFRQVTGEAETEPSREPASARSEAEEPAAPLNYFTAALPSGTASEGGSASTGGALFALDTGLAERADEASSPEDSLDYFAPALRRTLGHGQHHGPQTDDAGVQESVERLKDAVEGLSEQEENAKSAESKRSSTSRSSLDLGRLAECLFTPSPGTFGLKGG